MIRSSVKGFLSRAMHHLYLLPLRAANTPYGSCEPAFSSEIIMPTTALHLPVPDDGFASGDDVGEQLDALRTNVKTLT